MWLQEKIDTFREQRQQRLLGRIALGLLLECGGAAYLPQDIVAPWCDRQRLFVVKDAPVIELKAYVAYHWHGEHRELISELIEHLG